MFFTNHDIAFRLLDVGEYFHINSHSVGNRPFHAVSYRLLSDTDLVFDDVSHAANTGSMGYFPPNKPYQRISRNEHTIVVHFELFSLSPDTIELIIPKKTEEIKELFFMMLQEWQQKRCGYQYRCSAYFFQILSFIVSESEQPEQIPVAFQESCAYICDNLSQPDLSVKQLAKRVYLCEGYFRREFKKHYQKTPKQFILEAKINKAKALLQTNYFNIQEIALQCGFENEKYFSTVFKRVTAMTPGTYKKISNKR